MHENDRLIENVRRHEVAWSREVGGARHDLPGAVEDRCTLALVDLR